MSTKVDLYQSVTDQIVKDLEAGIVPWSKPWTGKDVMPRNGTTQRPYSGINTLILWMESYSQSYRSNQWLTFKQASDRGFQIVKGEKGTKVSFYKPLKIGEIDPQTNEVESKVIPLLRTFTVFNLCQMKGTEEQIELENSFPSKSEFEAHAQAESLLELANIEHKLGDKACYIPSLDQIVLPLKTQFESANLYYQTALHELTHWTKHEFRCDRGQSIDKQGYAFEELVAEIGSAFLCSNVGLGYDTKHADYIGSWLKALKNDKKYIFKAAAQAQKASDFCLIRAGLKASETIIETLEVETKSVAV